MRWYQRPSVPNHVVDSDLHNYTITRSRLYYETLDILHLAGCQGVSVRTGVKGYEVLSSMHQFVHMILAKPGAFSSVDIKLAKATRESKRAESLKETDAVAPTFHKIQSMISDSASVNAVD